MNTQTIGIYGPGKVSVPHPDQASPRQSRIARAKRKREKAIEVGREMGILSCPAVGAEGGVRDEDRV